MRLDEEQRRQNASSRPYAIGSPHANVAAPTDLSTTCDKSAPGRPREGIFRHLGLVISGGVQRRLVLIAARLVA